MKDRLSRAIQDAITAHIVEYSKTFPNQVWGGGALHARLLPAILATLPGEGEAAAEIAQLQARIDNITAQGVHSCHDGCQRPLCVMRRERDAARKQVEELSLIVEDSAKEILLLQLSRLEFDRYAAQAASGRLLPEDLFRYGWRLLCRVAREEGHCLAKGSGRDTLAYWVRAVCKVRNPAWFYRRVLREAVRRGWATKTTSPHGYSIFSIAPRATHKPTNETRY